MRGQSNTQLLKENIDLKSEMRKLRQKVEEQTTMVNEMLEELERRQPEFDDLRHQNDALTTQINDISGLLDEAIEQREAARRDARKAEGDMNGVNDECALLRHQVQDMTIQLRSLLWRREAEQNGLDSLPQEQRQFILESVENQVPDDQLPHDSATQNTITQHLVLYKTVAELQAQNAELLRTIRKVGAEHESQEVRNNMEQHKKDVEKLNSLRSQVAERDEQIKSLNLRSQSFKTERDMYYRIVTNRGQPPSSSQAPANFAQSVPAIGEGLQPSPFGQSTSAPEYDKLIKDLQAHINLLKEESTTDRTTSKSQIDSLTKDNTQLQSERIRLESQVRREQDRYNRLESTISLLQSEKDTLTDRYNKVQQTLAKQDDRIVKADQEAADAATRIQGLENEMVNLKASQNMSRTIEARLNERVKELTDERDRLSRMVSDIQSLRNEQELTNAENRRRLQESHDKLEADLQIARRKLEDELETSRKASLQRDYERSEAQRRIDDLISARNNAEVKSASADSTRQQLEQRVKDLQSQLQTAEDRISSLQPRAASQADGTTNEEDPATREEELAAQVADLQRKIERKQEDVEAVQTQVTQFQSIAQDAEDRLASFIEAHDRLEEQLNLAQQEENSTITDLQQRVEEISSELATSSTELTELRGRHEQEILQLSQQKESLEAEITRIKNDVTDYKAEAEAQSELVKSQAEIAARAQQDYEHELAKHGETMKTLRTLRDEHNQVRSEIAQFKTQAESARSALEQSQEHWKSTQEQYDTQIAEAKRRHDDLKHYNETLLKQFDEYKAQIDTLKQDRGGVAAGDAGSAPVESSNTQDMVVYLRREKEIIEVQLNLKDQEVKRLEQQISYAQNQLDQTREKLIAEQSKTQGLQSGASLENLQAQIEQLNLFRESNTTLRNDNTRLQSQLAERVKALEDLQSELEPLQGRLAVVEGELELSAGHLKAVEEDRDRWQKRHQDVLQRYDRIDPKELEDLKQKIETLQSERDQASEQVNNFEERMQTAINEAKEVTKQEVAAEEKDKARKGFNKVHNEKMQAKKLEIDGITSERDALQTQLSAVQEELAAARSESTQAMEQVALLQQQLEHTTQQLTAARQELETSNAAQANNDQVATTTATTNADVTISEDGQVSEGATATNESVQKLQTELEDAQKKIAEAQSRAHMADNKAGNLAVQLSLMKDRATGLDQEVAEKGNRIIELQNELAAAQNAGVPDGSAVAAATSAPEPASSEELQKLQDELAAARKEIEDLRTQLDIANSANHGANGGGVEESNDSTAAKAALDQREAELKTLEADVERRLANVQDREAKSEKILEKANGRVRQIRTETNEELERLKKAHEAELDSLRQQQADTRPVGNDTVAQDTQQTTEQPPPTPTAEGMINTEDLARPAVTDDQLNAWIRSNAGAKRVVVEQIRNNLSKTMKVKNEELAKLRDEINELKTQAPAEAGTTVKDEPEQVSSQNSEAALSTLRAEHETTLKEALVKKEEQMNKMFNMKSKIKDSTLANVRTKWAVVEQAAKETPTEEVRKVFEQAVAAAKTSSAAPASAAKAPAAPPNENTANAAPVASIPTPFQAQQPMTANTPLANGANPFAGNQAAQAAPMQGQNPFLANPFAQAQSQVGRGLPTPGFGQQNQAAPNQQQAGRGRGDGVGTGVQALRNLQQSGIPRGGGTGIPMPGGRGRGQQAGPIQTQQQNQNAPGAGTSQIGRGGGRGAGRGQGRGQGTASGQNSPRTSLNPGAQHFQPGSGRGQKRGAEDDAEGGTRGGKRARGRGGQGGGGAAE